MKKNVSIIGASGYSGAELLSILLRHPHVQVTDLFANSSAGKKADEVYPHFRSRTDLTYQEYSIDKVRTSDLVVIALPSGEAMKYVPELIDAGKKVIDLGGDFRLQDAAIYQHYYKHKHSAPQYLAKAVYGLPEWNARAVAGAQLIANPGCYVTSAVLPLLPLLAEGLIEPNGITISSLSGVSGAGRSASVELSFTEVNESVKAYKVGVHQHTPEIENVLRLFGGASSAVTFVPHLIPVTRGIYSSMYVTLNAKATGEAVTDAFSKYYSSAPFVRLLGDAVPDIKHVHHTNFIDIGWKWYERNNQLIVLSVIDNLVKGAAGQAVQNMNLVFGLEQTVGLL